MNDLTWVFELVIAPLAFALCLRHTKRALGAGRAAVELGALVLYGFALEWATMRVFSSHIYGSGFRIAPLGVPLAVPLVWSALLLSSLALCARLSPRTAAARAAGAALLCLTLDLAMEPVAVAEGLWRWTPPGPWLAVPVGNYVGWTIIVFVYLYGAEAFSARGTLLRQAGWRLLLAALALLSLLGVGFVWRSQRLEERLPEATGWGVWAFVLAAALLLARRRRALALGTSLGSRLGVVPGHGPGLVFLVCVAAFATFGVLGESAAVRVAVVGPVLVLGFVAGGDIHEAALASWRERMHGRLRGVESLVAVLMKRRNGRPWTREESTFLKDELRGMARYLPALLLFLLPGSVILLPLYAWLLDRRRGERKGEGGRVVAGPSVTARPTQARRRLG